MLSVCRNPSSHDAPANATLHLTDPDIETAGQLFSIFDILQNFDDVNEVQEALDGRLDPRMVAFVKKYDMKPILDAIKIHLYSLSAMFPPCGGEFVLVAAALGEWALCGRLVMTLDERDGDDEQDVRCTEMRQLLDWRGWTPYIIRQLLQISDKFLWAVCQAGTKHAKSSGYNQISYKGMGPDLAAIMQMYVCVSSVNAADV